MAKFQQRSELDFLVAVKHPEMNPTIGTSFLEHERKRNEEQSAENIFQNSQIPSMVGSLRRY